ncbi:hypothetical protein BDN72DRAFT_849335 [Pluteus cervinus]|uniref:Uncharacterized protein n=1 Tax=Pluteus cervinus TaxID=181527 RepID=A0ACD3A833_9AGAR|nr:hypothetical protein BDN72DRAFT_849335 [Pluteus cervinus]
MPARQARTPFKFGPRPKPDWSTTPIIPSTLPEDLEREIFEIAAESSQICAVNLTLVAKRVNIWITPILYRVLTFKHLRTCTYAASFLFKGHHVQEIYSTIGMTLLPCIHRFPNIKILILHGIYLDTSLIKKLTELPLLKELWFQTRCLPGNFTPSITFPGLTHLGLFADPILPSTFPSSSFPNLTHILVDLTLTIPLILSLLDTCLRLKVLLVTGGGSRDHGLDAIVKRFGRRDDRIVEFFLWNPKDRVIERSLGILWAEAEHIVDARR